MNNSPKVLCPVGACLGERAGCSLPLSAQRLAASPILGAFYSKIQATTGKIFGKLPFNVVFVGPDAPSRFLRART